MRHIILLLLLVLFTQTALGQKLGPQDFRYGSFEFSLFNDSTNQFSEATPLDTVRKVLGKPEEITRSPLVKTVKPDTLITFIYNDLTVEFTSRQVHLIKSRVDSFVTPRGISLGSTKQEVIDAYGKPMAEIWHDSEQTLECNELISYFDRDGASTLGVSFCMIKQKVREIIIGWGST